jgi:hypothetical protein
MAFIAGFGASTPAIGETPWAYVPASTEARTVGVIEVPDAQTEDVVSLVGSTATHPARQSVPHRVIAVDIASPSSGQVPVASPARQLYISIPDGAHWPDSTGRIAAVRMAARDASGGAGIRNPWEVRLRTGPAGTETIFLCGGIVSGGEGGPIAILNGHIVRRGDSFGRFNVAGILGAGVLLEKGGSYFVIPRGTRTTITTVDR